MKLPNIDKNSYLSIYIANQSIYASLSYVDYNSGRNYVLRDFTDICNNSNDIYTYDFWNSYFTGLREKFNWEIFREKNVLPVVSEGVGVSSVSIHSNSNGIDSEKLISVLRQVSYDINFLNINAGYLSKVFNGISEKVGYEDIVYLNLDLFSFEITRFTKQTPGTSLSQPQRKGLIVNSSKIDWVYRENLINNISNSKLKAFMSAQLNDSRLSNMWANYVLNPSFDKLNGTLQDILRSYITVQLLTFLNDNGTKFENIGGIAPSTLIIVTGNMLRCLNSEKLFLSLIDGLELNGEVDIILDTNSEVIRFGRNLVEGIESKEFVVSINDVFSNVNKVVIPNVSNKDRKVILTGNIQSAENGNKEIFAFSPEITFIELNNAKEFISGRFVQGAFWGEKYQTFEIYSDPRNVTYSRLVVDGRSKPVVYGPDLRTNKFKINQWLNENS